MVSAGCILKQTIFLMPEVTLCFSFLFIVDFPVPRPPHILVRIFFLLFTLYHEIEVVIESSEFPCLLRTDYTSRLFGPWLKVAQLTTRPSALCECESLYLVVYRPYRVSGMPPQ